MLPMQVMYMKEFLRLGAEGAFTIVGICVMVGFADSIAENQDRRFRKRAARHQRRLARERESSDAKKAVLGVFD